MFNLSSGALKCFSGLMVSGTVLMLLSSPVSAKYRIVIRDDHTPDRGEMWYLSGVSMSGYDGVRVMTRSEYESLASGQKSDAGEAYLASTSGYVAAGNSGGAFAPATSRREVVSASSGVTFSEMVRKTSQ